MVRRSELGFGGDEPGNDQFSQRLADQGLGEREQRIEPVTGGCEDEDGSIRRHSSRQVERRILAEDRQLQLAKHRPGRDPELVVKKGPRLLERAECVRLPPRPVQGEHVLAPHPLTQRMLLDEPIELADEVSVAAELKVGLDPTLEDGEPQLFQTRDRRLRELLIGHIGECRPTPEPERLPEQRRRLGRFGGICVLDELFEPVDVELAPTNLDRVARRPGDDALPRSTHGLPQLGDAHLQRGCARRWRPDGPKSIEQSIGRNRLVHVQQQERRAGRGALLPPV